MLDKIRIVMVNTTHSGNIGAAARAMKNMGLSRLVLVDPIASIDEEAIQRSSRAEDILHNAVIVPTLEDAIADCGLVIGTSARSRHIPWPLMSPRQSAAKAAEMIPAGNEVALVFGRESRGLTNEELHLCTAHVHIPTDENFSSLNVAQAIQVLCYEMRLAMVTDDFRAEAEPEDEAGAWGVPWDYPLATQGELDGLFRHMETVLIDIGFLDPNTPKHLMSRMRRLYQRAAPDKTEVNILRGILAAVQRQGDTSHKTQGDTE
ncbi:RNA methyltransferase [Thalassolituus sp. UBA2009]|uniref:RNA methyltransferase n=1 Tax=Thalassolituus sp. UBA2009 TaxID=1947658 RepID=UPI00257FD90A|nr:RNA methyltransferase [Thalassolituus sp. UBA2009]